MSWSLLDSIERTESRGSGAVNISGRTFSSVAARAAMKRISAYVETMNLMRKPISCIRIGPADFEKLAKEVCKQEQLKEAELSGLRYDGIPVVTGAMQA